MAVLRANVFSVSSLEQLKKDLEKYKKSLNGKMQVFIDELLKIGIESAEQHTEVSGPLGTHNMKNLGNIAFRKEVSTADGKVYGILFGHGDDVHGEWYENDGSGNYHLVEDTINSLLAIEFGTAGMALPVQDAFGVTAGQGTKSRNGHERDLAWYIITAIDPKTGKPSAWKCATAINPSQPMYNAGLAMYEGVKKAAEVAFRG